MGSTQGPGTQQVRQHTYLRTYTADYQAHITAIRHHHSVLHKGTVASIHSCGLCVYTVCGEGLYLVCGMVGCPCLPTFLTYLYLSLACVSDVCLGMQPSRPPLLPVER